jgi:hypothetical protein
MRASIATAHEYMEQAQIAGATVICKQLHHECFAARKHLYKQLPYYDDITCDLCLQSSEMWHVQYYFEEPDTGNLMEVCLDCDKYINPCINAIIVEQQQDHYVFQYTFLRQVLGRDIAQVILGHYFIVKIFTN